MEATVRKINNVIAAAGEYNPEEYRDQTKKVLSAANQILAERGKGDYTLLGSAIKMFSSVYEELPHARLNLTLNCLNELNIPFTLKAITPVTWTCTAPRSSMHWRILKQK